MVRPMMHGPGTGLLTALAGLWRWPRRAQPATVADMTPEPKRLWTIPDVARLLGVTPEAIADRVRRGTLHPHFEASYGKGVAYLFDPDRLAAQLSAREARLIHRG